MHNSTKTVYRRSVVSRAALYTRLACAAALWIFASTAPAAVFSWDALNRPSESGFAKIQVCIVSGSSTNYSWWFVSPSLSDTITAIRQALRSSWERTGIRFTDWRNCDDLSQNERLNAVGLYINQDAPNNGLIGGKGHTTATDPTVQFKPWGYSCANYNWDITMTFTYECVQQYAIHEFGHIIGFAHEWQNPSKPASCTDRPAGEPVLSSWQISDTNQYGKYLVPNQTAYDYDSIMTYDTGCADVTGVRFGSPTPDALDMATAMKMYPTKGNSVLDEPFYLWVYDDLSQAFGSDGQFEATRHWFQFGINEGRVASTQFDVRFYVAKYPDLQAAFGSDYRAALNHWVNSGISEGRQGSRLFDVQYYLAAYADLRQAFGTDYDAAMRHWTDYGIGEGRRGSAEFDARYYLQANPDVARVYGATNYKGAMQHYLKNGIREGRRGAQ